MKKNTKQDVCYVYLMGTVEHGWYKIGWSYNPEKRYDALYASLPFLFSLMHMEPCPSPIEAMRLEKALHEKFKDIRLKGEWFQDLDFPQFVNFLNAWRIIRGVK